MPTKNKKLADKHVFYRDEQLKAIKNIYGNAASRIIKTLKNSTDFQLSRKRAILKQIDDVLQEADSKVRPIVRQEIEEYYKEYADDITKRLENEGFPANKSFSTIDRQSVEALADEMLEYQNEAFKGVKRSTSRIINEASRKQLTGLIAEGRVTGDTKREISERITDQLKNGMTALIDKGGRRWSFESYSMMLTRTKMVEAANQGMTNRMLQSGYDLVQVSDHVGECELCSPWENLILSSSGKHPDYPSVDEAKDAGLFHPNCRHRLLPYHEKLVETSTVYNPETGRYIKL